MIIAEKTEQRKPLFQNRHHDYLAIVFQSCMKKPLGQLEKLQYLCTNIYEA